MSTNPLLKRLLDAGLQFSETSQGNIEKVVDDLVKAGQVRRKDAARTVQQLVERGRQSTEELIAAVQAELSKRLGDIVARLDGLEDRLEEIASRMGVPTSSTGKKAPAKKAPAKKAPAKKAPAKKAPAKKAPAKKVAAGPSGVAKVTARTSPAKKAASKR